MHLQDKTVGFMGSTAIVGNSIPIGVGLALGLKLKGLKNVSAVFFGDGCTEEGAFYESVNFAVVRNLPVLFVCENNFYSVYSPLSIRQPESRKIYKMVESMGLATSIVDGNDIEASYFAVQTSLHHLILKTLVVQLAAIVDQGPMATTPGMMSSDVNMMIEHRPTP